VTEGRNTKAVKLGNDTVARLAPEVAVPRYERKNVRPSIIHFGVGGFHRAHQAVYTDDVLAAGDLGWGIRGAGITAFDLRMNGALSPQNFLYTVVARDTEGEDVRVVGSIVDFLLGTDDPTTLVGAMSDESTRIISMTITENGYCYRPENVDLDFDNPGVKNDIAGGKQIKTIYGCLRAALTEIRKRGAQAPTILSCDNLPQNGDRLRKLFLQFLERVDPGLRGFVETGVEFPNCMVDRITPITTDDQRTQLSEQFGIIDEWPVYCERFRQWVIEDRFPKGRPDWSVAGATFVSDVVPFERMKIRLLNGSHSALGYVGYMMGFRRVDIAMADPDVRSFVRAYMDEITPTVGSVPGMDLEKYKDSLIERFSNPAISDQILRLAQDGSKKIPNMILEPVGEILAEHRATPFASFALASWIRFLEGTDEQNKEIPIDDPIASALRDAARLSSNADVTPFFALKSVFPPEIAASEALRKSVAACLSDMHRSGVRSAVRRLLKNSPMPRA